MGTLPGYHYIRTINALSATPDNGLAMPTNTMFIDDVLEKSFSHMYICICIYIFMKSAYPKHDSNLALALQTQFFGLALSTFWKRVLLL